MLRRWPPPNRISPRVLRWRSEIPSSLTFGRFSPRLSDRNNTPLYNRYLNNAQALATAKSNFAAGFALAQRDPVKFDIWPVQSASLRSEQHAAIQSLPE